MSESIPPAGFISPESDRHPARRTDTLTSPGASFPGQQATETVMNGSASSYLAPFRLDSRICKMPVHTSEPLLEVMVNFAYLRVRVYNLLCASFLNWNDLRERISADRTLIDARINAGCHQLGIAFIYLLYSFLRRKTSRFHPSRYNLYRNRCFFDEKREIPLGLAYIIEQFGLTPAIEAYGNNRYFHVWNGEDADNFGLNLGTAAAFNEDILHGFLSALVKCGVQLRSVDNRVGARTLWDSLFLRDTVATGISAETVFKADEYDLPRDVFLSYGLLGAYDVANRPIRPYGPRIGRGPDGLEALLRPAADADSTFGPIPGTTKNTTAAADNAACAAAAHTIGHVQRVHNSGIIANIINTVVGPPVVHTYNYHTLIYGRGPPLSTMTIASVARGLSDYEIDGYFRSLFRKGP